MLANPEPDVAARPVRRVEILVGRDVVVGRAVQVGAPADQERQLGRDRLEDIPPRRARTVQFHVRSKERNLRQEVGGARPGPGGIEKGRLLRVGLPPGLESLVPPVVGPHEPLLAPLEKGAHVVAHVEMLVGGEAEPRPGGVGEFSPSLPVPLRGALHLGDPLCDDCLHEDELGLAALRLFRPVERLQERRHVVAVHRLDVPSDRPEPEGRVLALRHIGHRVERDVVRVVEEDQVFELLVAGELDRLHPDPLLHAAVAREAYDMVVEDRMVRRVEARRRHLAGDRHPDRVSDALAKGARRGLDPRCVAELRVARGDAVQRAELRDLLHRDVEAEQMEPRVEEHAAVTGGQDEPVAVDPARALGIEGKGVPEEHRAYLGAAERQAEVPGVAGMDGVDRQPARLVGRLFKDLGREGHRGKVRQLLRPVNLPGKKKRRNCAAQNLSWRRALRPVPRCASS